MRKTLYNVFSVLSPQGINNRYDEEGKTARKHLGQVSLVLSDNRYMAALNTLIKDARASALWVSGNMESDTQFDTIGLNQYIRETNRPMSHIPELIADIDFGIESYNSIEDIMYVVREAIKSSMGAGSYRYAVHIKPFTIMQIHKRLSMSHTNVRVIVEPLSPGNWSGRPFVELEAFAFLVQLQLQIFDNLQQDGYQTRTYKGEETAVQNGIMFENAFNRLLTVTPTLIDAHNNPHSESVHNELLNILIGHTLADVLHLDDNYDWPSFNAVSEWVTQLRRKQKTSPQIFHGFQSQLNYFNNW